MDSTDNAFSGDEATGKNNTDPGLSKIKAAYQLGYDNGYSDATEEEDYNEDFSDYVDFFDAEENFDQHDYDDTVYGSKNNLPL